MWLLPSLSALALAVIVVVWFFLYQKSKKKKTTSHSVVQYSAVSSPHLSIRKKIFGRRSKNTPSSSTLSGESVLAQLAVQKNIVDEISLAEKIGEGAFGEVYIGLWKDEKVAVKKFQSAHQAEWANEKRTFESCPSGHENLLRFIQATADTRECPVTQYWVVTEYHKLGSLCAFLEANTLTTVQVEEMARSIARGLNFLHQEVKNVNRGKPALAHCDMKTTNILLKDEMTCAIADLDKAICASDRPGRANIGTLLYLSPGVLDKWRPRACAFDFDELSFHSFQQADIYACGLIFWELANRTEFLLEDRTVFANPAVLPLLEHLPEEVEDIGAATTLMKKIVCGRKRRPPIRSEWSYNRSINRVCEAMVKCWSVDTHRSPTAVDLEEWLS